MLRVAISRSRLDNVIPVDQNDTSFDYSKSTTREYHSGRNSQNDRVTFQISRLDNVIPVDQNDTSFDYYMSRPANIIPVDTR